MVEQIVEIPLPGRILASPFSKTNGSEAGVPLPGFVAGPENQLVATTFCRLLESAGSSPACGRIRPRAAFPPAVLALFGPSGTGKTHLCRGLVRQWQQDRGEQAALYITAQDFRRQFATAMTDKTVSEFRRCVRSREILAIDDLHHLPDEAYLLQELRYVLDTCEDEGSIVVVASSLPVTMLPHLPVDLRGRLAAGLMLQLAAPGSAARMRIVQHVSTALGKPLPDETIRALTNGRGNTANHLIGAIHEHYASLSTGGTADSGTGGLRSRERAGAAAPAAVRPTLPEIVAVVARYYRLPQKQLKSGSRRQSIVLARATVVYLARELTAASYEEIGRELGGRDHTTIMHNYKKLRRDQQEDFVTRQAIEDLRRILLCH